jgi:hypothetical protein
VSLDRIDAEVVLRDYLARCHGIRVFEILDHEARTSPMIEQPAVFAARCVRFMSRA